mgnify:FL=1
MDLSFRILWFEDNDEWYDSISRRVTNYIERKFFKVEIEQVKDASNFDLRSYDISKYDLLIIDYDLGKDSAGNGVEGNEIINEIRQASFFNDILFYSSLGFIEIVKIMKKHGLQGVFISARDSKEFMEKVKSLVDKAIRRTEKPINIRGIVMDATSTFDNKIEKLVCGLWPNNNENEKKISDKITKLLEDDIRRAEDTKNKFNYVNSGNLEDLLNNRDFSSIKKSRLLCWCIRENKDVNNYMQELFRNNFDLENINTNYKFSTKYKEDIIDIRNSLAHSENENNTELSVVIDNQKLIFDQEQCAKIRNLLLSYENILNGLYNANDNCNN